MPLPLAASRERIHDRHVHCAGYRRRDGLWDIEGHRVEPPGPMATTAFQTLSASRRARGAQDPSITPPFLDACRAHARSGVVIKERWPAHYTGDDNDPD